MHPSQTLNGFWRPSTVALILVSLYSATVCVWFLVSALNPDAGEWDIWSFVILSVYVVPAILIPIFLFRAFRQKRSVRLGRVLPWVFRAVYVSVILAIWDSWSAGTDRRDTLFSKASWAMRDGGTRGYVGFCYSLTYYRRIGGEHGPEVWFWFTPFRLYWTSSRVGVSWLWTHDDT